MIVLGISLKVRTVSHLLKKLDQFQEPVNTKSEDCGFVRVGASAGVLPEKDMDIALRLAERGDGVNKN